MREVPDFREEDKSRIEQMFDVVLCIVGYVVSTNA